MYFIFTGSHEPTEVESLEYLSLKRGKCASCPSGPIRRSDGISPEGSIPLVLGAELSVSGRYPTPQLPPLQGEPSGVASVAVPLILQLDGSGSASSGPRSSSRSPRSRPDTSPPAASPETSVSVVAPPAASPGVDGSSPSRPPPAGVAEASAPSSPTTASTGDVVRAQSHPWLDQSMHRVRSGGSVDGARSAANAPEASSAALGASRFPSVRWEDIEDIVATGTDRTVRQVQESAQSHFLALARLVVD
ncbi:unnamed protein product [Phytophthora fragariaefolia]|uniref:Unnamed protein product n=1 Tax=Phytophthora fragariaefolia TaxID=1490495 RepID=A0A9W7CVM9_9STRA|nr:unnamed protein product [Phytophthora fragariaefolia]